MKLTCVIIDDEPLAVELLKKYVEKTPFLELKGTYSSAIAASDDIRENPVNLLFLDIQMPGLNGMEFSGMVPEETRIIFTTAFDQYALDGFRVNALDYLLKPISYNDFLNSVNKAMKWFEMCGPKNAHTDTGDSDEEFICIKSEYKLLHIRIDSILYIEGLKDYVKIFLEDSNLPVISLASLKTLEEKLPANKFIRVHRSYIVQKSKIKVIDRMRIVFGKTRIPVSETYRQNLTEYIDNIMI